VFRAHRQAAFVCLAVALLSQLLLPAMHAAVHAVEHAGAHEGGRRGERARWIITHSGGRAVAGAEAALARALHGRAHSHGGAPHRHDEAGGRSGELTMRSAAEGGAGHRHHGDAPGERHGARSLEHLTACYLEATPAALAIPFRRLEPTVVPLVAGRIFTAPIPRAHAVRGPPPARGAPIG
jgi:hypothetical protein